MEFPFFKIFNVSLWCLIKEIPSGKSWSFLRFSFPSLGFLSRSKNSTRPRNFIFPSTIQPAQKISWHESPTAAHDLIHLHCRGNRFKTCHILSSRIISRHCTRSISKSNNHTFPRNSCCLLSWRGSSSSRHPFFRWPGTREPRLEIRKPSVFPPSTREGITIPRSTTLELPLLLFFPLSFLPRSIVPPSSFPSFDATMSPLNSRHPAARTRNLKFEASINEEETERDPSTMRERTD